MKTWANVTVPPWAAPLPAASGEIAQAEESNTVKPGMPLSVLPVAIREKLERGEEVNLTEVVPLPR
jgi:hypothetical protein